MLGRITLNPVKHIDPIGSLFLPAYALYSSGMVIGWAKPTPVNPLNFRNRVWDDILTSVAGPVSNFVIATAALILLSVVSLTSATGHALVGDMVRYKYHFLTVPDSFLTPIVFFLYDVMWLNIILGVFNLIPVPPLDGSHVLRHFLPDPIRRAYDTVGVFGLILLVVVGQPVLSALIDPCIRAYNSVLTRI
jgi:Zn-dependent protease